jgi:hypothetical protein
MTSGFRAIPPVNRILEEDAIVQLIEAHSRDAVLDLIRQNLEEIRAAVSEGADPRISLPWSLKSNTRPANDGAPGQSA